MAALYEKLFKLSRKLQAEAHGVTRELSQCTDPVLRTSLQSELGRLQQDLTVLDSSRAKLINTLAGAWRCDAACQREWRACGPDVRSPRPCPRPRDSPPAAGLLTAGAVTSMKAEEDASAMKAEEDASAASGGRCCRAGEGWRKRGAVAVCTALASSTNPLCGVAGGRRWWKTHVMVQWCTTTWL